VFKLNTVGTGFIVLHDFAGGSDGAAPLSQLTLLGNTLFGTTQYGGPGYNGTVFSLGVDGGAFSVLHAFTTNNTDGAGPFCGLALSGQTLYGTTASGGPSYGGTVFRMNTDGTGFEIIHFFSPGDGFTNEDGIGPYGALVSDGTRLYGTTSYGGAEGNGTIYALDASGTNFQTLYSFAAGFDELNLFVNSGGANPRSGLILSEGQLYGTAPNGGAFAGGTVFRIGTDGTAFSVLHDFVLEQNPHPVGRLALSGETLLGTTPGSIFVIKTNGTYYSILHTFPCCTNFLGVGAGLTLSNNVAYGVARNGGSSNSGALFSLFIPPLLTINPSGADLVLTWPTNAGAFTLQTTPDLTTPNWTTALPSPVLINGQNTVTSAISATQGLFRLAR
jgi:uncharacterized repeat protein (TIGR03803 family)